MWPRARSTNRPPWLPMTTLPAKTCLVLTLSACPMVHGCTEVELGAVEVSWNLRNVDGSGVSCGFADVVNVELHILDALDHGFVAFPCSEERGVTRFDLAPGRAELWLEP